MIRILGNNLEKNKKISLALTSIFGIGRSKAILILKSLNINLDQKVKDLSERDSISLRNLLESSHFLLEGNLKRVINQNIKRLIDINSYRGRRHIKNLPARGQRTRTNSRTVRKITKIYKQSK